MPSLRLIIVCYAAFGKQNVLQHIVFIQKIAEIIAGKACQDNTTAAQPRAELVFVFCTA